MEFTGRLVRLDDSDAIMGEDGQQERKQEQVCFVLGYLRLWQAGRDPLVSVRPNWPE
jgi:hypothetical protein